MSAIRYICFSLAAALIFLVAAVWRGEAPLTAVLGGTVWVFILSMIVTMPLVTGWITRRSSEIDDGGESP